MPELKIECRERCRWPYTCGWFWIEPQGPQHTDIGQKGMGKDIRKGEGWEWNGKGWKGSQMNLDSVAATRAVGVPVPGKHENRRRSSAMITALAATSSWCCFSGCSLQTQCSSVQCSYWLNWTEIVLWRSEIEGKLKLLEREIVGELGGGWKMWWPYHRRVRLWKIWSKLK